MGYIESVMQALAQHRNRIVTALYGVLMAIIVATAATAQADDRAAQMDQWFTELADPDNGDWARAHADIQREWSKSGSPAFDLLLIRGREAMEAGDLQGAIEHLTALTDQAPEFAEGWNARATAYYMAGLYGPSIVDIEHVLALEPRHFGAISGLGLILQETGNKQEAMRAFRHSLSIHPHQEGIRQALDALEKQTSGTDL
jgi:tetratricopeptide (TPR) repeat protein